MTIRHTREWEFGDTAQQRWARELVERGNCVLPAYAFEEVTPETKAPVMLTPSINGKLVTPDVLCFSSLHGVTWHEVKAKSVPTWYRRKQRWEHGFDYALLQEYQEVQARTDCQVIVVVYESETPRDLAHDSPKDRSGVWLFASLEAVMSNGEHREDWPGGKADPSRRGRAGAGGWLWPRSIMQTCPAIKPEAA